ncbi:MAG: RNB domain-containing ribonuclease, partial [Proteobacteria bacterium]|nr:RNB domain-containing ribonuclease [Pseudomonadota bacterium]
MLGCPAASKVCMKPTPPIPSAEPSFPTGAIVLFENDGLPVLAAVLGPKKQGYQLLSMRGREVELRADRLFALGCSLPSELKTSAQKVEHLLGVHDRALKDSATLNLEELWSLVKDEGESFSSEALASLYLGTHTPEQHLSLRLGVMNDRIFFKRKGDLFQPRSAEVIAELKRSEEALAHKMQLLELTISAFIKKLKDPTIPFPGEAHSFIETLEELAVGVTDIEHSRLRDAKELLTILGDKLKIELPPSKEKRSLFLLKATGHFSETTNIALIRHRVPTRFTPQTVAAAEAVRVPQSLAECPEAERAVRQDLTHLRCYTIDDAVTEDMDDAVSIEQTHDGYTLGIHISDVASSISPGSALDLEAKRRATSLYLAGVPVNMLPEPLSLNALSLVAGQPRLAVSYLFDIDRNFQILSGRIVPSIIKVTKRLSYEEAVEALERGDHELTLLHSISASYESERLASGAMKITKKEVLIYPKPDGSFRLHEMDEDDLARSMVGELMVLANSLSARTAEQHRIPMAFRGQEQPDPDMTPAAKLPPEGPAFDFYLRTRLKKSTVGLTPTPHASLGLNAYLQATSPIRRYVDLLHQRQLLGFLFNGKPLYSAEELRRILEEIEPSLAAANQVSKETRRFYLLKYLQWCDRQKIPLSGTVVRL